MGTPPPRPLLECEAPTVAIAPTERGREVMNNNPSATTNLAANDINPTPYLRIT